MTDRAVDSRRTHWIDVAIEVGLFVFSILYIA